ncbi:MAG TPA: ATP synthase F0 subunit B [Pyrinomonadaceae bacterium]|nr:ATP synthase F0 subunit B [Pyrinomonadaceae bacterium]
MILAFAGPTIQLVPDGTMIFHLVLIIVMVAVLNATLLKPINRILEERERRTKGRLSEAQTVMQNVEQELREYERRLRDARSEGYALIERERSLVAREREQRVATVKAEISQKIKQEREGLIKETERAKEVLSRDAQALAVNISSRILRRPVAGQPTS